MKKSIQLLSIVATTALIYSCSTNRETAFSKRKYYDFKHGNTEIALNNPSKKTTNYNTNRATPAIAPVGSLNVISEARAKTPVKTPVVFAQQNKTTKTRSSVINRNVVSENKTTVSQTNLLIEKRKELKNVSTSNNLKIEQIVLIILAILIPPVAVYLKEDSITSHFWIDLILCLLFWLPGIIFALLVVADAI